MTYLRNTLYYLEVDFTLKHTNNLYLCLVYDREYKFIRATYMEEFEINRFYRARPTADEIAKLSSTKKTTL